MANGQQSPLGPEPPCPSLRPLLGPDPAPHVPQPGPLLARWSCPPLNRYPVSIPQRQSRPSPSSALRCPRPTHAPAYWPLQGPRNHSSVPLAVEGAIHPATPPFLEARKSSFLLLSARYCHREVPARNTNLSGRVPSRFAFQSCPRALGAEPARMDAWPMTKNDFFRETPSLRVLVADALSLRSRRRHRK